VSAWVEAARLEVALVDRTGTAAAGDLAAVAAALTTQAERDLAPAWHVSATVRAEVAAAPGGCVIALVVALPGGLAGYRTHLRGRPRASVAIGATAHGALPAGWTLAASHELLEMLVDPARDRLIIGPPPPGWTGASASVEYLAAVCDPCQRDTYAIDGIAVSDFVPPRYYQAAASAGEACTHAGSIKSPRQLADSGFLAFVDPADGHVWRRHATGGRWHDADLGVQQLPMSPSAILAR
jgi:hypothetical protein